MIIGRLPFYQIWKNTAGTFLKRRRFCKLMRLLPSLPPGKVKVLEVGCSTGKDMIQFLSLDPRFEIWGADILQNHPEGIHFVRADAADLPFSDKDFDLVISIGLLEHIEPMEKLCRVVKEMDRVGKHLISVVPSVSTLVEPHCGQFLFPLRLHKRLCSDKQISPLHLNFFSEHTWTKFHGFRDCRIKRIWYLPPLVKNTVIYK